MGDTSKVNINFCFLMFCGVLGGCLEAGAFQPSPPYYQSWVKEGADGLDIKKKLLECGDTSPAGGDQSMNESALVHLCMVQAGYMPYKFYSKKMADPDSWCRNWPALPACQPGADIPVPDLNRRLQSRYCRIRSSSENCFALTGPETPFCKSLSFEKPFPECLP